MADKIRANYQAMLDTAKQLDFTSMMLEGLEKSVSRRIDQMQGGVLLGDPGEAMAASFGLLCDKIRKLAEINEELAKGIVAAINDMKQADSSAAGDFN